MGKHHWLEVAEYTALTSSVVGSITAVLSQQIVYAAAPVALSLSLSTINRRRFEQQTQQSTQAVIAQVDQQIQALPSPSSNSNYQNNSHANPLI
jgi:hypothetical protein